MEIRMRVDWKRQLSPQNYMLLSVLLAATFATLSPLPEWWPTEELVVSWSSPWELLDFIWKASPQNVSVKSESILGDSYQDRGWSLSCRCPELKSGTHMLTAAVFEHHWHKPWGPTPPSSQKMRSPTIGTDVLVGHYSIPKLGRCPQRCLNHDQLPRTPGASPFWGC